VLPVKRAVRVAEALDVGDTATVTVELIDFTHGVSKECPERLVIAPEGHDPLCRDLCRAITFTR